MSCNSISVIIVIISIISSVTSFYFDTNNYDYKYEPASAQNHHIGLNEINEKFECNTEGFFADLNNDCKTYYHCISHNDKGNGGKFSQITLACGEGHVFDQSKMYCLLEDDAAIPCGASMEFFYLNDRHDEVPTVSFLTFADIDRAQKARPNY